ncbi:hypothetical protein AB0C13_08415 [Streptomyces sp. NPDC049099]|uniref:hypothetical protein n=1 Tax=Streptomyces sp. NPDC049099 TaxID=3155768 RepID=UPI0034406D23
MTDFEPDGVLNEGEDAVADGLGQWLTTSQDAPTYRLPGDETPVGELKAGRYKFYAQKQASAPRKNINSWWVQTDDDNHHKKVWINVDYLTNTTGDLPVPGLPKH